MMEERAPDFQELVSDHRDSAAHQGYDDTATVAVPVNSMTSTHPAQSEPILVKGLDQLASRHTKRDSRQRLTTTDGVGRSKAPFLGSTGIASPASIRSSM